MQTLTVIAAAITALILGVLVPIDAAPAPTRLQDLPSELVLEIGIRLDHAQTIVYLASTCRLCYRTLQTLLQFCILIETDMNATKLRNVINQVADCVTSFPWLRRFADRITPQQAMVVYDRVVFSDMRTKYKLEMIRRLVQDVNRAAFSSVVWSTVVIGAPWPYQRPSYRKKLITNLPPDLPIPELDTVTIPTAIIQAVAHIANYVQWEFGSQSLRRRMRKVRERFPAPFNRVFPFNHIVAEKLLLHDLPLAEPDVVLALLRYGLRFEADLYLEHVAVSVDALPRIYPLLRVNSTPYSGLHAVLKAALLHRGEPMAAAVLQQTSFRTRLRTLQEAEIFVSHLIDDLYTGDLGVVRYVLRHPIIRDLISVPTPSGTTLLHAAVKYSRRSVIWELLRVPGVNLHLRDDDGHRPFDFMSVLWESQDRSQFLMEAMYRRPLLIPHLISIIRPNTCCRMTLPEPSE